MQNQIEQRGLDDRGHRDRLAGGGRAGQNEDARPDYGADTQSDQAPGAEHTLQTMLGILRLLDQPVDAFRAEKLGLHGRVSASRLPTRHGSADGLFLLPWPVQSLHGSFNPAAASFFRQNQSGFRQCQSLLGQCQAGMGGQIEAGALAALNSRVGRGGDHGGIVGRELQAGEIEGIGNRRESLAKP